MSRWCSQFFWDQIRYWGSVLVFDCVCTRAAPGWNRIIVLVSAVDARILHLILKLSLPLCLRLHFILFFNFLPLCWQLIISNSWVSWGVDLWLLIVFVFSIHVIFILIQLSLSLLLLIFSASQDLIHCDIWYTWKCRVFIFQFLARNRVRRKCL